MAILVTNSSEKVELRSREAGFKPDRGRPEMRTTNGFYPTKALIFRMTVD